MHLIKVTHANIRDREVYVDANLLFGWYYSDAAQATILLGPGQAAIPVKESVEKIAELKKKGSKHGKTKRLHA